LRRRRRIRAALAMAAPILGVCLGAAGAAAEQLSSVRLEGNRRVESNAIEGHITAAAGGELNRTVVDHDIKEIYAMGFFDNVWATVRRTGAGAELVYHVAERPYIEEIRFNGVNKVKTQDVEAVINVTPRTIFDPQRAFAGLEQARKFYSSQGYPDAKLDFEMEVGPDNSGVLRYTVEEGKLIRVEQIRFEGVKAFKKRKLKKLMTTREAWLFSFLTGAGLLNEDELNTDVERLTAFYYDNGYIHVRVDEPQIDRVGDGLVVTMKLDEGPQFHVRDIRFEGDVLMSEDKLLDHLKFKSGDVFRTSLLRDSIFELTEAYGDLGHAFAEVEPDTDTNAKDQTVNIAFHFKAGEVVNIRRIDIAGNSKTRDKIIRRELAVTEGQRFSGTGLQRSKRNVRRLGFFDEVDLTTNRTEKPDEVDLLVKVKEGRTGAFSAGAGFSSADSFLFNARISERNLFGRGQRLVLNGDIGTIRQNFQFSFTEPWFLNRPLAAGFDIFDWSLEFDRFRRGGTGFALRSSYPVWRLGFQDVFGVSLSTVRAGLEYRLEQAEIDGVSGDAPPDIVEEQGTRLTSSVTPSLVRNTLDHPFDPTDGSRQSASAEFAGLGGDTDFVKLELEARWYVPTWTVVGRKLVWAVGGEVGWGLGDSGRSGEELPVFERYFPGGINSIRGFKTRSLGPTQDVLDDDRQTIVDEEEIGGSQQLIFNNELIIPLLTEVGVKGVLFFDCGNAFLADDGITFGDLRYAAGWGIRWLSPFGPLRIEIGYPLDRREGEKSSVFQFAFGSPF
jgi:outer membrane protein insertion porin family